MRDNLYCLFFPHHKNNHRAKLLHFKSILIVISLLIVGGFFFSSNLNPFSSRLKAMADISTQELLRFTNEKRVENGLPPLNPDSQLDEAASRKADDMFANDYWAHNSPDGVTPWVWIKGAGYDYIYAGENLARGFTNSDDVVNAWMASPDHRENLLSENFKDVGFSVKSGKLGGEVTFLVVQEFGNKTPVPVERTGAQQVLPPETQDSKVLAFNLESLSPKPVKSVSYNFIALIIFSFIIIMIFDLVIARRKKVVRFVGHNLDHIIFLFVVLIVVTIFSVGHIL